ncbi:MAG TPA: argininosuccinate lyase, partial [Polyangia bacterium]
MSESQPPAGGRGARFATAMDPAAAALNASIDFDRRLLADDVRGSQAHARMLAAVGLISSDDADKIVAGLDAVAKEIASGERPLQAALEDIHMNVESRLTELIGEPGRRLHTARSRNDQVATDLKLFARAACAQIMAAIDRARLALCRRAREHAATLLPGYTHLQRAQVVTLGHHLLAYAEMLGRDRGRFFDAARRADESPLGSGALAGTSLPIDRQRTALDLGFANPTRNSLDAVSDRDFAAEIAFACAQLGVHLSRLGEELVLWSSTEFGFVRLGEGYCSGSSLMPQKRNPDIGELLRGKPGRLIGNLVALLTISKGLTLAYNKDLQESQEPLYDAVETTQLCLSVLPGLIETLEFNVARMNAAAQDPALGATDLAEHLVREKGVPFRRAHEIVGGLVRHAETRGVTLAQIPTADLGSIAPELDQAAMAALDPARAVAARTLPGGP